MVKKLSLILAVLLLIINFPAMAKEGGQDTWIDPDYVKYAEEAGKEFGIQPELIESIIEHESSGKANASNGNCKGLMQVYESVHRDRMRRFGVSNLCDPKGNIRVACSILVELFEKNDDCAWVMMSYNGSSDAKRRAENFDFTKYARSVMDRAYELETIHGKHDIKEAK